MPCYPTPSTYEHGRRVGSGVTGHQQISVNSEQCPASKIAPWVRKEQRQMKEQRLPQANEGECASFISHFDSGLGDEHFPTAEAIIGGTNYQGLVLTLGERTQTA